MTTGSENTPLYVGEEHNAVHPRYFSTPPATLPCSLFYLSELQRPILLCHPTLTPYSPHLPCWIPLEAIALALYGSDVALRAAEREQGGFFLWATEFSCVHTTWRYDEQPITIGGYVYHGGPETFFQLMKSATTSDHEEALAEARGLGSDMTPEHAYAIGRRFAMREDWEGMRVGIMRTAVEAKFRAPELRNLLLSTGNHRLIDLKPSDGFWGTGHNGDGRNMLGVLVAEVRALLRDEASS
ncbi:hypothetical protein HDV00_005143 [Rhizophlyctis rosea]|nr:hypothetical protein HDV00_005143 [Rhizophlyctis rosea]